MWRTASLRRARLSARRPRPVQARNALAALTCDGLTNTPCLSLHAKYWAAASAVNDARAPRHRPSHLHPVDGAVVLPDRLVQLDSDPFTSSELPGRGAFAAA